MSTEATITLDQPAAPSNVDPAILAHCAALPVSLGACGEIAAHVASVKASPRVIDAAFKIANATRHLAEILAEEECEKAKAQGRLGAFQRPAVRLGLTIAAFVAREQDRDARALIDAERAVHDAAAIAVLSSGVAA